MRDSLGSGWRRRRALCAAVLLLVASAGAHGQDIMCPSSWDCYSNGCGQVHFVWPDPCGCEGGNLFVVLCVNQVGGPPELCGGGALGCPARCIQTFTDTPCIQIEETGTPPPSPSDVPSAPCAPSSAGRPVSLTTGEMFFTHTDASVGDLVLTRTFNSAGLLGFRYGAFGFGWNASFDLRLRVVALGIIEARLADGTPVYYTDTNADGVYEQKLPAGIEARIETISDGFVRMFRRGGSETYDSMGRIRFTTDASGVVTSYTRDGQGRLSSITRRGRSLSFEYTSSFTTPARVLGAGDTLLATYTYTGQRLTAVDYPGGFGYRYGYDAAGRVLWVKDAANQPIETHTYDVQGRARTSEIADGQEKLTFTYEPGRTTVTDALEHVTVYDWAAVDHMYRVTKVTGPCESCGSGGETQEWTYDGAGHVTAYKDGSGALTQYEYDTATGTLVYEKGTLEARHYEYYPDGRLKTRTAPNGQTTSWTYVAAGPESITEAVEAGEVPRVRSFTYTPQGDLETVTDPRGKLTRFAYNAFGDLVTVTDPLGTATPEPDDHVTRYEYDALGRRIAVVDALGHRTETTYNGRGEVLRQREVQRENGVSRNLDTLFEYDGSGRLKRITDANLHITDRDYDSYGRLWHVYQPSLEPGGPRPTTIYGYDLMSNLKTLEDAEGHATSFDYDAYRRLTTVTYPGPELRQEKFTYDSAGRVKTRTDRRGVVATYDYDTLGRLVSKTYSDGTPAVSFRYDEGGDAGFLTSADQGGRQRLTWDYDLAGQLRAERFYADGAALTSTVEYTYDAAGNRTALKLDGQAFTTYEYDDASRLTWLRRGTAAFGFDYDAAHHRTALSYPSGVHTSFTYDDLSRVKLIEAVAPTTAAVLASAGYTHDDVGNRLTKTLLEHAETYHYDAFDRLRRVERGAATTESYTYDRVGNRMTSLDHDNWTYNARNELLSYGPWGFTYDENGNTRTRSDGAQTWTYVWDVENQLTRACRDATSAPPPCTEANAVASFTYDLLGRRVRKVAGGVTTSWTYDGADVLREVSVAAAGTTTARYVHGPGIDEPLAREDSTGALTYYHADGLGSILKATDATAVVTLARQYDAWGNPQLGEAIPGQAFTGREWDPETGLYYYRARYYDPKLGRFISEDPIGFWGGGNFFAYVGNNPARDVDPDGLFPRNPRGSDFIHCMNDPVACARKYVCVQRAEKMTMRVHGHDTDGTRANAFKHCFWSCCIAKAVGATRANKATGAHEMIANNPLCHMRMDSRNNAQGAGAGEMYPGTGCRTLCQQVPLQACPVGPCAGGGAGSGAPSGPGSASGNGPASEPGPASQ